MLRALVLESLTVLFHPFRVLNYLCSKLNKLMYLTLFQTVRSTNLQAKTREDNIFGSVACFFNFPNYYFPTLRIQLLPQTYHLNKDIKSHFTPL